jgi:serine phosphatase RsbU (regulator of sigma subunit)
MVKNKLQFPEIFYKTFEPKLLKEIANQPIIKAKKNDVILNEGMMISSIPLVKNGKVQLLKVISHNLFSHIYYVNPGESCIITYTTVLRNNPFPAKAVAVEDSQIIMIPKEVSQKWLKKYPSWQKFIMKLYDLRLSELIEQHKQNTIQTKILEQKNKEIIDSINYAKNIQQALLPNEHKIKKLIPKYFILFKPRDIVSGDFYWIEEKNNKLYIIVADATGHGVPGAFISTLGLAFIREIISTFDGNAADFLNLLKAKMIETLVKNNSKNISDGLDMSMLIIHPDEHYADFAAAYQSIVIVQANSFQIFKGNKMPIGKFLNNNSFINTQIPLRHGDTIYMFTDGYYSQLGGKELRKFQKKRFYDILHEIVDLPLEEQKQILEQKFNLWKGNHAQTDDVTVLGIKL